MREHGFSSSEASRLHQYHAQMQQRFELLRVLKYYRTPQATRSFGRAYVLILPWIVGPYFAWVYEETNDDFPYALSLAGFTFLVLLGLMNTIRGLEDPFVDERPGFAQGIDNVRLEYECAAMLQALEQYYVHAETRRSMQLANRDAAGA